MSCSSHWPTEPSRRRFVGWCASSLVLLPLSAQAQPPAGGPDAVASDAVTLRFLGMTIYTARLWSSSRLDPLRWEAHPLALELTYARRLKGQAIAERSITEMRRGGAFTDEQAARWLQAMGAMFPDVASGDRLTGLYHPERGAEFLFNDQRVGQIDDALFARLFFGIWLGTHTSEPAMRQQLLARWL
jgi:hypothetical protein